MTRNKIGFSAQMSSNIVSIPVESIAKVTKDIIKTASLGNRGQAKALVKTYYQIQRDRLSIDAQKTTNSDADQPADLLRYYD